DSVGIAVNRRKVGPEILRAERRPDFLDDLAAAILEPLLEGANRLIPRGIVRADGGNPLIALVASPLTKHVMRLRSRPAGADEIRIIAELSLREIICGCKRGDI